MIGSNVNIHHGTGSTHAAVGFEVMRVSHFPFNTERFRFECGKLSNTASRLKQLALKAFESTLVEHESSDLKNQFEFVKKCW